ncbi:undecaprenyl-diphosphate phosphatase [bacterium]|nr:undecaprenyl-diphosphate phosphatase [bacterium]
MIYLKAIILAVVEGITEFLPISSTGHMILVDEWMQLSPDRSFSEAFMVIIQLPAILSVVIYFWKDLWPLQPSAVETRLRLRLWATILLAFLPAALLGLLFHNYIEEKLFNSGVVAGALLVGGVLLILLDRGGRRADIAGVHDISPRIALLIGLFQCLAMIPGTSRSAATIIGAMALGASRVAAAEFSFFLAIPTMAGATALTVAKHGLSFTGEQWGVLAVGSLVSFGVAYGVVAGLMIFIRRHSFAPFGYYRIALALIVLGYYWGAR